MNVFIVYQFTSIPDSVWDNAADADARALELDAENRGDFASVHIYELNKADGMVG